MTLTLTQRQVQALKILRSHKSSLLWGGTRSGKSLIICLELLYRAEKYPGSRALVSRLHFSHARTSIWHQTLYPLISHDPRWRINHVDWYAQHQNGSEIWVGGFDEGERIEKILGHEYGSIFLNEVSQISYETVALSMTRLSQKIAGMPTRAYMDCNPPSPMHWSHKLFIEGIDPKSGKPVPRGMYGHLQMNPIHNVANLPSDFMATLETLPDHTRRRMLLGEWVAPEGMIYYKFGPHCLVDRETLPPMEEWTLGIDFGIYSTAVLIGWAGDHVYVVGDHGEIRSTASMLNNAIKMQWPDQAKQWTAYGDPAGGERLQEIDCCMPANNSVEPGIDWLNAKMERGEFHIVAEDCPGVMGEIYEYHRDEMGRVVKENDHYIDALRYGTFSRASIGAPRIRTLEW